MVKLHIKNKHLKKATRDYIDEEYDSLTGLIFDPIKYAYEDYLTNKIYQCVVDISSVFCFKTLNITVTFKPNPLQVYSFSYVLPDEYNCLRTLGKFKEDLIQELEKQEYFITIEDDMVDTIKDSIKE